MSDFVGWNLFYLQIINFSVNIFIFHKGGTSMAFFDTLKQNLMTASQITMDKAKNTAEILKLKDQIRQDKREIRSTTFKIGEIYRELHSEDYEEAYEDCFQRIARLEQAIEWKEDAVKNLEQGD